MSRVTITHVDANPDKCGGRPCVAGTRIRVQDIYVWHELDGQSPDEIAAQFPQLSLADIHGALAYFHDHREEIEADVQAERTAADKEKSVQSSKLVQKLTGQNGNPGAVPS